MQVQPFITTPCSDTSASISHAYSNWHFYFYLKTSGLWVRSCYKPSQIVIIRPLTWLGQKEGALLVETASHCLLAHMQKIAGLIPDQDDHVSRLFPRSLSVRPSTHCPIWLTANCTTRQEVKEIKANCPIRVEIPKSPSLMLLLLLNIFRNIFPLVKVQQV